MYLKLLAIIASEDIHILFIHFVIWNFFYHLLYIYCII